VDGEVGQNGIVTTAPDPKADWWTTSDVAAYLGVRVGTVSTYRARGQMPAPDQTVGRTHMWRPARITRWYRSGVTLPRAGGMTVVPDPHADWWTTSEIAAYLGVRVATVSTYRARGQMPAPDQSVGRTHMWRPARIIEWHRTRPRPGVGGRVTGG
jgi:hypothetical protein